MPVYGFTLRALITGFSGFAGSHLADHLLADTDWQVWGTVQEGTPIPPWCDPRVTQLAADLRDPDSARQVVQVAAPDVVFHLAGQAFVPAAWHDPWGTFETNVRMQLNLLEALKARHAEGGSGSEGRAEGSPVRVVVVTSNEIYGTVPPEGLPTDEEAPLAPINPYATSKAAQDLLAGQYARTPGLHVVRARPFNHIGPRQDDRFVVSSFARQVVEMELGLRPPALLVGDLSAERDFTDVRDMVRAYALAAVHGRAGEAYNLGFGTSHAIRSVIEVYQRLARVTFAVETDPARLRPSETPRTCCDRRKAERELSWVPRIDYETTLADVLADWRDRLAGARAPAT